MSRTVFAVALPPIEPLEVRCSDEESAMRLEEWRAGMLAQIESWKQAAKAYEAVITYKDEELKRTERFRKMLPEIREFAAMGRPNPIVELIDELDASTEENKQ